MSLASELPIRTNKAGTNKAATNDTGPGPEIVFQTFAEPVDRRAVGPPHYLIDATKGE